MSLENMIKTVPVKIKLLHPDAKIPTYGTKQAAGCDIYSIEDKTILPGETAIIKTGIALEIPVGKVVLLWDRGGVGVKSQHRFAGVLDSDYRGEYNVMLHNHKKEPHQIKKGDKIVQGLIQDYYKAEFEEVSELSESERGENWNSSTGR
jgi:dUTP pyrophosphatase